MKKTILILTALLLAVAVSAQKHEKNIFSVRGGMNVASMTVSAGSVSASSGSRIGYHIGIANEILLGRRLPFYLETGLSFSSRGGKEDEGSLRPVYLQIPLLLNYHIDIKNIVTIQPFAGIYYGIGFAGSVKSEGLKYDMFGDQSGYRRSDLGVRLGAGVSWKHLYFGLSYDFGCLNQLKNGIGDQLAEQMGIGRDATIRANCFSMTVGYKF